MATNDLMSRIFEEMVQNQFKDALAPPNIDGLLKQLQGPAPSRELPADLQAVVNNQPQNFPPEMTAAYTGLLSNNEEMGPPVPDSVRAENPSLLAEANNLTSLDKLRNQAEQRVLNNQQTSSRFDQIMQGVGGMGKGLAGKIGSSANFIGSLANNLSGMFEERERKGGLSALAPNRAKSMQLIMDREQKARQLDINEAFGQRQLDIQEAMYNQRFGPEGSDTLSQRRLHSTFEGGNGNQMIAMQDPSAPEGFRIHDSGIKWNPSLDIQRQPDGTFVAFNRNNPQEPPRILWKPTEAEAAHARAVDQAVRMESATTTANLQAVKRHEYPATHLALEQGFDELGMYMDDLQETISLAIDTNPGGWQAILTKGWPASDQRRLNNRITSLKANLTFENLVALKKSGVGLGAVSDAELQLLANKVAVLDIAAEPIDTVRDLRRIYSQYNMMQANFHDLAVVAAEQAGVEPTPLEDFGSGSPDAGNVPQSGSDTIDLTYLGEG